MTECQYCHTEYAKGLKMHERYCKSKPLQSSSDGQAGAILKDQATIISPIKTSVPPPADDNYKKVFDMSKQMWWIQFKLNNIILLLLFMIITIGYIAVRYKV